MKLYVIQTANENITVVSEWIDNENGAKQSYHNTLKNLYADAQTIKAEVAIFDEQLDVYEGYKELVNKANPEPEPNE